MKEIKTVAVIGLGAIGSYLASNLLAVTGKENLRVIAGGERRERLLRNGIIVNGVSYYFNVISPEEETGFADLAIMIPKFTALSEAAHDMKNQIGPDTIIMAPLNGVESEEIVAKIYGWDRILYSLCRVSVVRTENVSSFNPEAAQVEFGEKTNVTLSDRVLAVRSLLEQSGIRCVIQEDMVKAMWNKFMANIGENQTAAVLGLTFGAWHVSSHANVLREMAMREVVAVAQKKGISLTEDDIRRQGERVKKSPRQNKPSTLQDLEAGRKTEVDMLAGTMIRLGKETGVPTPLNEFFYHAIKVLEEKNEGLIQ